MCSRAEAEKHHLHQIFVLDLQAYCYTEKKDSSMLVYLQDERDHKVEAEETIQSFLRTHQGELAKCI